MTFPRNLVDSFSRLVVNLGEPIVQSTSFVNSALVVRDESEAPKVEASGRLNFVNHY